jgi:hypothetical protein
LKKLKEKIYMKILSISWNKEKPRSHGKLNFEIRKIFSPFYREFSVEFNFELKKESLKKKIKLNFVGKFL